LTVLSSSSLSTLPSFDLAFVPDMDSGRDPRSRPLSVVCRASVRGVSSRAWTRTGGWQARSRRLRKSS
jgi:hypothetical protein